MTNFSMESYNESLFNFPLSVFQNSTIDVKFSKLQTHINNCINMYAPLRKRTKKELKFAAKPWLS